jgi:hypothetical protein
VAELAKLRGVNYGGVSMTDMDGAVELTYIGPDHQDVSAAISTFVDKVVAIWHYSEGKWAGYSPAAPRSANNLVQLIKGQKYRLKLTPGLKYDFFVQGVANFTTDLFTKAGVALTEEQFKALREEQFEVVHELLKNILGELEAMNQCLNALASTIDLRTNRIRVLSPEDIDLFSR